MLLDASPIVRPCRRAFSLVEILLVMSILAILAALVIPSMKNARDSGRRETMASNIRLIRAAVEYQGGSGAVPLSATGHPLAVDPLWFDSGQLPFNPWTGTNLLVETVAGPANQIYPANKTFDPSNAADANCWYNSASGRFMARVPAQVNAADTLTMFNEINGVDAANLAATN